MSRASVSMLSRVRESTKSEALWPFVGMDLRRFCAPLSTPVLLVADGVHGLNDEDYAAAQARNARIGERCREIWYVLVSLASSAFVMQWWRVGAALLAVSAGFYAAWSYYLKRSLRLMEDRLRAR